MRYLVQRLGPSAVDPSELIERCGDEWGSFETYANTENVIRFGLRKDRYKPGKYHIYTWPLGGKCAKTYTRAYKLERETHERY